MSNPLRTRLTLLLLALFSTLIFAEKHAAAVLAVRQAAAPPVDQCLDYSRTANLSVIGTNSTYRATYLQESNMGTLANQKMFNAAQAKLPKLTADAALNQACGNLTTVALTEAEKNFSSKIVGPFREVKLDAQKIDAGPLVVVICGLIVLGVSLVWGIMP
ncbi:uncharacterized protein BDR25DRAFT_300551 [Lindgomyces ingoldianus]|uniref:Uncharacterized protein n=1 Tax=Lindgomyces ingoldianus TaxID=673940 RepID=A0ACB6RDR2_9PLEO|nr:uncharacterized protein BDR25DRAFT_300551 [Lindgomyces ingoldianus]KAF2476616.1 hypothetical protein BDR25DRAFT_300551 [Lindgomyces ingoldianus]